MVTFTSPVFKRRPGEMRAPERSVSGACRCRHLQFFAEYKEEYEKSERDNLISFMIEVDAWEVTGWNDIKA
ncbi:hypothetical protein TNCT_558781 [Trichonephila clavata]|nr:hypothetical protein TNCT_558781 [Trichonephila clavata]